MCQVGPPNGSKASPKARNPCLSQLPPQGPTTKGLADPKFLLPFATLSQRGREVGTNQKKGQLKTPQLVIIEQNLQLEAQFYLSLIISINCRCLLIMYYYLLRAFQKSGTFTCFIYNYNNSASKLLIPFLSEGGDWYR